MPDMATTTTPSLMHQPPTPEKAKTDTTSPKVIKAALGRFVESNILATVDELESSGALEDPNTNLRAVIAAEYGFDSLPRASVATTLEAPKATSVHRRRSTGGSIKRPIIPERALSLPLTSRYTLRFSLTRTPSPRIEEEGADFFAPAPSSPRSTEEQPRTFDISRAYSVPSPRPVLPTAAAIYADMDKLGVPESVPQTTSSPTEEPVDDEETLCQTQAWVDAQGDARRALEARVAQAIAIGDFTPLRNPAYAHLSREEELAMYPRLPYCARPRHLQPVLTGRRIRQAVSEYDSSPVLNCPPIFSGGVDPWDEFTGLVDVDPTETPELVRTAREDGAAEGEVHEAANSPSSDVSFGEDVVSPPAQQETHASKVVVPGESPSLSRAGRPVWLMRDREVLIKRNGAKEIGDFYASSPARV